MIISNELSSEGTEVLVESGDFEVVGQAGDADEAVGQGCRN